MTSQPFNSPAAEYLFMLSVLDRIFLKLLGYSGEYVDRSAPGAPATKELL